MKIATKIIICFVIFVATILTLLASNYLERLSMDWRPYTAAVVGAVFSLILYSIIRFIQDKYQIQQKLFFTPHSLWGAIISLSIFLISSLFISASDQHGDVTASMIGRQMLFQLRPALIEEIGFRYGIVALAGFFFGGPAGLIAGTIPFGILHLLNFNSGAGIQWDYIIGTSVAGFYLSVVFLKMNLGAAILAHYSWNVLASVFSVLWQIPQERIEGAWSTLILLMIFSVGILLMPMRSEEA